MTSANGGLFAGGVDGLYGPDLYVYQLGNPDDLLFRTSFLPDSGSANLGVEPRGLAFSPDGTELFALYGELGGPLTFQVFSIDGPGPNVTTTTVTSSSATSTYGENVALTAQVDSGDGVGTVSFDADGSPIPGCSELSLSQVGFSYDAVCFVDDLPLGAHSVSASFVGDDNNDDSSGTLAGGQTVVPAPLTVTATSTTRPYGASNPTLGATISGFVLDQTLSTSGVSGSPICSSPAVGTSRVGGYPITCTIGTLTATNYSFAAFVPGSLTVTKAPTSLTASPASAAKRHPTLSALLTSQVTGMVVPGVTITFSLGSGKTLCTGITGTDGVGTCHSQRSLANESSYRGSFAGNKKYLSSAGAGQISM